MGLGWTSCGEGWEASYEAYDTPAGPAVATAEVFPSALFPGKESAYETWVRDPHLERAGCPCRTRVAYGSKVGGDHEADAKAACEGYGVAQAKRGIENPDVLRLYERAFPKMAVGHLERLGAAVEGFYPTGRLSAKARVLEGGYEPALVDLWLGDDLRVEMGY